MPLSALEDRVVSFLSQFQSFWALQTASAQSWRDINHSRGDLAGTGSGSDEVRSF
jgi:hypothetical protein